MRNLKMVMLTCFAAACATGGAEGNGGARRAQSAAAVEAGQAEAPASETAQPVEAADDRSPEAAARSEARPPEAQSARTEATGSDETRAGRPEAAAGAAVRPAGEDAVSIVPLAPGASHAGVRRAEPVALREGLDHDEPAITVTGAGRVVTAVVSREGRRERVWVREAPSVDAELGPARPVSDGARAWRPALAAAPDGTVWLAWCGRQKVGARSDHGRSVFLRRLGRSGESARPGAGSAAKRGSASATKRGSAAAKRRSAAAAGDGRIIRVSHGPGRHCDPDLAVATDGTVHVAWEAGERIAWRAFDRRGRPLGQAETVSSGPFDRRPAVTVEGGRVHVAWDSLVDTAPTGAEEPDYDLRLRTRGPEGWGAPVAVDARAGIQAAPRLAPAPGGGVLVAYHSSHLHPLVKWWQLRRVRGGVVEALPAPVQPAAEPEGEQQGAELPALAVSPSGRIAVATRPSQGAYLHLLDGDRRVDLDLTRRGWGARGQHLDAAFGPDGTLLIVRRARHEAVLERFSFDEAAAGEVAFVAPDDPAKPEPTPLVRAPETSDLIPDGRVLRGDVHMHSAASDATGPPDEIYARAWVRGYDFAALTDHGYIVGSRMFLSEHDEIAWLTDVFDRREGFTTLHAFEWTTPPIPKGAGHRNVYFRDRSPTPVPGYRENAPDTEALWAALKGERAFAAPHHTSWTGTDWELHDPAVQRHVEIVSVHGAAERPSDKHIASRGELEGMFAVDALKRGLRFGFLGGSDAHGLLWHHGLGRRRNPWAHGLTGVVADGTDRAALWDALYARRTFATSGIPMELLVRAGGVAMGGEGVIEGSDVEVRWQAAGTRPLTGVEIVRDGETVHRLEGPEHTAEGRWVDRGLPPGPHSWYVRAVQQTDDRTTDVAWSSPVFLDVRPSR